MNSKPPPVKVNSDFDIEITGKYGNTVEINPSDIDGFIEVLNRAKEWALAGLKFYPKPQPPVKLPLPETTAQTLTEEEIF